MNHQPQILNSLENLFLKKSEDLVMILVFPLTMTWSESTVDNHPSFHN